jgi:protein-L-isoaspartate O-methyltransferase
LLSALELLRFSRAILPTSLAGVAVALLLCTGPTAFWRHSQIGVGGLRQYHSSQNDLTELMNRTRRHILWQADGLESSVAVADADSLAFIQNGKSDGNAKTDAGTQVMCGMVGAALHPHPETALVIGLGTGSTAGWLAAVPTMQRVDAVELERSILKVADQCAAVNHQALSNPKLHVTVGDGREILLTTPRKYDLIVSEPSNPYRAGVASLFTREFYQSIEHRLTRGGMFLQWMQTYDVDDRTIEIFYRTLGSVFPNVESWQTEEGDLLLVATREPVAYDVDSLRQRLTREPFRSALHGAWHADGLEEFLGRYVGNARVGKCIEDLQPWPLNTDDRTVIEFAFARCVSATNVFHLPNLRAAARLAGCDKPNIDDKRIDWQRVREAQISSFVVDHSFAPLQMFLNKDEGNRADAFVQYSNGNLASALQLWRAQSGEPRTLAQLMMVAECLSSIGDPKASKYLEQLAALVPLDAEAIRAELLAQQGQPDAATKLLQHFLQAAHEDAWPDQNLIRRSLARAEIVATAAPSKTIVREFYDILSTPLAVWNCDADRLARLVTLGLELDEQKPGKFTAVALQPFEAGVLWQRKFLEIRKACYGNLHDPRASGAARDLDDFITGQAFTADTAALVRVFKSAPGEIGYATERGKVPAR